MLTTRAPYQRLVTEYPDLTTPTFSAAVVKHDMEHHITTSGLPVYTRTLRLQTAKLAIAKEEFATMESNHGSALCAAQKASGPPCTW